MIRETIEILKKFADQYNETTENYLKSQDILRKNYIGDMLENKEVELNGTYNASISALRESAKEEIAQINKLKGDIETEIPEGFEQALSIYKSVELDKNELAIIIDKYSDNYFASKKIKQLADKNSIRTKFVNVSDKIEELKKLKINEFQVIDEYKGKNNSYLHEVFIRGAEINDVADFISKSIELIDEVEIHK